MVWGILRAKPVHWPAQNTGVQPFTAFLLLFIVATRWVLSPRYLYYFDSANFAYSLEDFNPALHQPQPPGYALFVGLIRLIHLWVGRPEKVLLVAGLLAACAATLLIRILASEMFGRVAGILAPALLASDPVFWFGGVTNQIRVFLSLGAIGIGLLAWRALVRPNRAFWFAAACAGLGIAGGFRPDLAVLLIPLLVWVWIETGRSSGRLAAGMALCAACALPWIVVTILAVGGVRQTIEMLWSYAGVQFHGTSALFGAANQSAYQMFLAAVVWNFLGAVVWFWAVPIVRPAWTAENRRKAVFLLLGFLPPFLFSAFIHIGDPDQALASISFLTLSGSGVLAAFLERFDGRRVYAASLAVMAAHSLLFFVPPTKLAKAASYRTVAAVDRLTTNTIDAINDLRSAGPLTIIHYGSQVASRQLSYYYPKEYVVVLPNNRGEATLSFYQHRSLPSPAADTGVMRPGSRRIVLVSPAGRVPDSPGEWMEYRGIHYLDLGRNATLSIGPFQIVPAVMQQAHLE